MQVLSLSNQKEIALEITVTNKDGDDAHEASLIASFPRSLSYSAYRTVSNVSLSYSSPIAHAHTMLVSDSI